MQYPNRRSHLNRRSLLALPATAAFSLGLAHAPWGDLALKESDHKKLAKDVSAYFTAKDEKKGIQESFAKLTDTIEKTQKKLKDQDLLAAVEDWEEVFRLVTADEIGDRVRKGKVVTEKLDAQIGETEVTYCAPKKYTTRKGPIRLVLTVPEAGKDPEAYLEESWADPTLREEALIVAVPIPTNIEDWNGKEGVFAVMTVLSAVNENFVVDYDRIILAGTGKGFSAAVATASAYPQLFAGVVGIGDFPVANPENLRAVPSLLTAEGDAATAFGNRAKELGFENVTVQAGASPADVWVWIQDRVRDAYPAKVTFFPRFDFGRSSNWLSVDGVDLAAGPHIEATVDRASNTITIDAEQIGSVTISYNDLLVDMSSPVKLVINDAVQEEHCARNQRTMIETAWSQGDWGRIFTYVGSYDVPLKENEESKESKESKESQEKK